jgi:hypothetical protein
MAPAGANAITVRVEMPEVWDVVQIAVSPDESVHAVKARALAALYPIAESHSTLPYGAVAHGVLFQGAFVMKLRGFEVIDENVSLDTVGAVDGSIFLLTHRRRRPVR